MKAKINQSQTSKPKNENPWLHKSALNAALDLELCQQMGMFALQQAVRGHNVEMVPDTIAVAELRQLVRRYGPQVYMHEGTALTHLFGEMTLAVYQAIEVLYCSRLHRRSQMIWRMLQQMARRAGSTEISYEAVWMMCEYLAAKRAKLTKVSWSSNLSPWWLIR